MVRTRFAPSPTGYLHIGGVRTALFNWLFARKHGGQFILRIDDTDQQRNVQAALEPILHGFKWLGLDWDEGPEVGGDYGPYYQSQRSDRYQAAVDQLLASGHAYRDYAKPDEVQAEREAADKEKRSFVYSRTWMAESDAQAAEFESQGRQAVVRLKMPREGCLELHDLVRGNVRFEWANEQDHVIQRADGSFIYHLATVVDDHDFQISHVIRAEEHLSNTPRQVFIAQSLGYSLPEFAHVPFVAEPGSKTKLSKRKLDKYLKNRDFAKLNDLGTHIANQIGMTISAETFNPVIVDFYEQIGFLPDAIVNYLLLLGWSLDDKTEYFSRSAMIDSFSLERINKAPASFDPQKLLAFQQHYMQEVPVKQKAKLVLSFLQQAGLVSSPPSCDVGPKLTAIVQAAGDRLTVAGDILDLASEFFVADQDFAYDEKAFQKRLVDDNPAVALLREFREELAAAESFDASDLERMLKAFVEQKGIKIGQIIHALRVAITGKSVGFGMFETLSILGKPSVLARIDRTLSKVA
ncbi:MAG: glutamate--tRNA ligase [Planctomycetales bacterium]|nr:glutamate--tRNA ligase [Planctomycetales bacterium]